MRVSLLVLALVLAPSCARHVDPLAPPPSGGRELVMTAISVTPTSFRAGETARIEVSVMNVSSRKTAVLCFPSGCTIAWEARDAAGEVVAPSFVCTARGTCFELAPHETVTQAFEWRGDRYDPTTGDPVDLPPGTYVVRGGLDPFHMDRISAPVTVELRAR